MPWPAQRASTSATKRSPSFIDFARSEGERLDKELMSKLAPPMKVNEVDKEAFIKGSAAVYQEFGKEVPGGSDLIKLVQSLR